MDTYERDIQEFSPDTYSGKESYISSMEERISIFHIWRHIWERKDLCGIGELLSEAGEYRWSKGGCSAGAAKQCRDELTDLFIWLLTGARQNGDVDDYKKLYASAKRRNGASIKKIDIALAAGLDKG